MNQSNRFNYSEMENLSHKLFLCFQQYLIFYIPSPLLFCLFFFNSHCFALEKQYIKNNIFFLSLFLFPFFSCTYLCPWPGIPRHCWLSPVLYRTNLVCSESHYPSQFSLSSEQWRAVTIKEISLKVTGVPAGSYILVTVPLRAAVDFLYSDL